MEFVDSFPPGRFGVDREADEFLGFGGVGAVLRSRRRAALVAA